MTDDDRPPENTPWGQKDHEEEGIPGFWWVSTPGHGGLYLRAEQREAIPENLKARSADRKGMWWEEDCAWSLPVICLLSKRPESSLADEEKELLENAHDVARDYYPDEWENLTGRKIADGQSYRRDEEKRLIGLRDNLVVRTAWRSSGANPWIPEDMLAVAAYPGKALLAARYAPAPSGEARYFLVPKKEYEAPHFIVDPARHREITGKELKPQTTPGKKRTQAEEAEAERIKSQSRADELELDMGDELER